MLKLICSVQNYAWGKAGKSSTVAKLVAASDDSFQIDELKNYAELWMGTHPSGPSCIYNGDGQSLKSWLASHPSAVGNVPTGYDHSDIPFLFKVLSIKTALSIQAHPDKALAVDLNRKFPNVYKDDNHKPEMSIALTDFEALSGFRGPVDILNYLSEYPELYQLIGEPAIQSFENFVKSTEADELRKGYKHLFNAFMSASDESANKQVNDVITRLQTKSDKNTIDDLIIRLNSDYPNDRGIFCPLLLNYLTLTPGEAFFMGPNEPHAYLSGDCVECMALSDNVVRAGLTPKFKDVETLCDMLHYRNGQPATLDPSQVDEYTKLYRPPAQEFPEFEVEKIILPPSANYQLSDAGVCSILLLIEAANDAHGYSSDNDQKIPLSTGCVVFTSADVKSYLNSGSSTMVLYRAHVNLG